MAYKDNEISIYKNSFKTFLMNFNLAKYLQKKELEMIKLFLGTPCPLPKKPPKQKTKNQTSIILNKL